MPGRLCEAVPGGSGETLQEAPLLLAKLARKSGYGQTHPKAPFSQQSFTSHQLTKKNVCRFPLQLYEAGQRRWAKPAGQRGSGLGLFPSSIHPNQILFSSIFSASSLPCLQDLHLPLTGRASRSVYRLFNDGHSNLCEVILHCSFDLHFSDN